MTKKLNWFEYYIGHCLQMTESFIADLKDLTEDVELNDEDFT